MFSTFLAMKCIRDNLIVDTSLDPLLSCSRASGQYGTSRLCKMLRFEMKRQENIGFPFLMHLHLMKSTQYTSDQNNIYENDDMRKRFFISRVLHNVRQLS